MKRMSVGLLGLALLSGPAMAQDAGALGVYGVLGSGGVGLGISKPLSLSWGLRGELAQASVSDTYTQDRIDYKGKIRLRGSGVFADYRPYDGAFRLVLGATVSGSSAELEGQAPNATYTINGQTFNATGNSLRASIKYPGAMPYLGLGWGHGRANAPGWNFAFDLGLAIGKPKISLTGSGGLLAQPGAAAAIAAEERKVQDDVSGAKVLPVVKVSAGYLF